MTAVDTEQDTRPAELKAVLSTDARNNLPDSAFACTEGGVRKYPHHKADGSIDLPHLRNALSRVAQAGTTSCGRAHLEAHAKAEGIGQEGKDLHLPDAGTYPDEQMEIKSATVQDFQLTEEGEILVAFAELDAVDREQDYTFTGAFPSKAMPISHFNHGSWPERGGHPTTGRVDVNEVGKQAVAKGKFFMDTTHGRDAYHTVKGMAELQQWSYGYNVLEKAAPPTGIKARRGLKRVDPHELSPVLIGAGANTRTLDIKSLLTADLEALGDDATINALLKGGPLAGLPFAEMSSRLLRDVEDFTTRAAAIADMRVKEGRAISTARMETLRSHRQALADALAAIDSMVAGATPKDPAADGADEAKARALRVRSRLAIAKLELSTLQN